MRRRFFLLLTGLICFSCNVDDEVPENEAIPFPGTYTGTTTRIVKQNELVYDSVGNIIDVVEYQDTMESMEDTVWVEIGSTGQSFLLSTTGTFNGCAGGWEEQEIQWEMQDTFLIGESYSGYETYSQLIFSPEAGELTSIYFSKSGGYEFPPTWQSCTFFGER